MSNTPKNSYFYQGQQKAQPPGSHAGAGSPNPKGSSKSMEPVKFTVVQGQDAYYGNAPPKPQKVAPRPHDGAPSTSSARRHGPPPPGPGSDAAFNPSSQGQIPSYSYTSPPNISSGQPNHFGLNDQVEVRITTDRWVAALIIGGTAVFDTVRKVWTQQVQYQDDAPAGLATRGHVGVINLENIRRPAARK